MMSVQSSRSSASSSKPSVQTSQKSSPTAAAGEKPEPQSQVRQNYEKDSFEKGPSTSPSTSKASNPEGVAQKIAKDATGWNYDHTGGKTWEQTKANENRFDSTKSGVCTDMAMEAAQRFKKEGVNARVQFGNTDRGNHAWVEYQNSKGQWEKFDPTAAASSKNADAAITPMDNGMYNYGKAFSTYEAPAEN
jgi:Transglutaminase-like superfamily